MPLAQAISSRFANPVALPGTPAKTPVVLAHGFFGFGNTKLGPLTHKYFYGVEDQLHHAGHPVLVTQVSPTAPIVERAAVLTEQIRGWRKEHPGLRKPILVAHSMGGLDARHALTHLGLTDDVAALATVATPHRGSPVADWVLKHFHPRVRRLGDFVRRHTGFDLRGSVDLTTARAAAFNDATPNVAGFPYYSVAAVREREHTFPGLRFGHDLITPVEGANDGLVSRRSARWGTPLDDWACDHTHSRNQLLHEKHPQPTGDVGPLYQRLVDEVARRVNATK